MTFRSFASLTLAVLVPVALVTGCGANPAGTKKPKKKTPAMNQMQMGQGFNAPNMGAPAGPMDPAVAQMLDGLRRAQASIPGFVASIETFDKGPAGTSSDAMKVAYKKPSTLRIEMTKASGQAQGAKILWTGGSSLKIKPSFLPMSVEKSVTDEAVKSKNGWTIRDTEVNAIFKVLFDPGAQIKPLGVQAPAGKPLMMFQVQSPASPKGATGEQIGIDQATGLPGARLLFKGNDLIYKLIIKNMTVKPPSAAELEV